MLDDESGFLGVKNETFDHLKEKNDGQKNVVSFLSSGGETHFWYRQTQFRDETSKGLKTLSRQKLFSKKVSIPI